MIGTEYRFTCHGARVYFGKEGETMTVNDFAVAVAKNEGKKKELSIAQIKEVLKVTNQLVDGKLYKLIRTKLK